MAVYDGYLDNFRQWKAGEIDDLLRNTAETVRLLETQNSQLASLAECLLSQNGDLIEAVKQLTQACLIIKPEERKGKR